MRRAGDQPISLQAVWFFPSDYVGFWRRLAVELADSVVIAVVLLVVTVTVALLDPAEELSDPTLIVLVTCWAALIYGYFVVLKRSRFATVGYRLARVRIVDACGRPPGLGALTLRLSFGLLGPFNLLLDMLWIPSDRHKQALRDKFAHMYVGQGQCRAGRPGSSRLPDLRHHGDVIRLPGRRAGIDGERRVLTRREVFLRPCRMLDP